MHNAIPYCKTLSIQSCCTFNKRVRRKAFFQVFMLCNTNVNEGPLLKFILHPPMKSLRDVLPSIWWTFNRQPEDVAAYHFIYKEKFVIIRCYGWISLVSKRARSDISMLSYQPFCLLYRGQRPSSFFIVVLHLISWFNWEPHWHLPVCWYGSA